MRLCLRLFSYIVFLISSSVSAQTYNTYYDGLVNQVSSANILADLTTFENFGIKELGTTELNNTRAWINGRYQALGYTDIVEQTFSFGGNFTQNIIITKTGTVYPNTYIIIDGHYDTINGPGTNDNGSGTVLIMELARLLKDIDTEYSIKFIHFSGEENGLIGSTHYVNNTVIPQNLDISLVFNIDEVGGVSGMSNNTIVCERDQSSPPENNAASDAATTVLANCFGLYSNLLTEISFAYASDYIPFENNGEVITGIYEKNESPYAHTINDVLSNMDVNYLFEVTKGSLAAALHFAVGINTLGIDEVDYTRAGISFSPNPSSGFIQFNYTAATWDVLDVSIVNLLGESVFNTIINRHTESLDLSFLSQGLYLVVFKSDAAFVTQKLLID